MSTAAYGGFDYFVADGLSMGGGLWTSHQQATAPDALIGSLVSAAVGRLGLDVPMTSWLSWYPRFSMAFGANSDQEASAGYQNSPTETIVSVTLFTPLLAHPAKHFFVGFGPSISHDLSHAEAYPEYSTQIQNQATTIGAGLVVGGWLGGRSTRTD